MALTLSYLRDRLTREASIQASEGFSEEDLNTWILGAVAEHSSTRNLATMVEGDAYPLTLLAWIRLTYVRANRVAPESNTTGAAHMGGDRLTPFDKLMRMAQSLRALYDRLMALVPPGAEEPDKIGTVFTGHVLARSVFTSSYDPCTLFADPVVPPVTEEPPVIITQPSSLTVNAGATAVFTVVATSSLPMTYQWFYGSTAITGATSASLSLAGVQSTNVGSYHVTVTNDIGMVTSDTVTLAVQNVYLTYYGKNLLPMLTGAEVAVLATVSRSGFAGTLTYAEGPGYVYFAYPASLSGPSSIMVGPFPAAMATNTQGFTLLSGAFYYASVTVDGVPFRLYRSFNKLAGSVAFTLA